MQAYSYFQKSIVCAITKGRGIGGVANAYWNLDSRIRRVEGADAVVDRIDEYRESNNSRDYD